MKKKEEINRILEVLDLKTIFYTDNGIVPAVNGVSFSVDAGKTLGIVGESGCGKSVTALSIMRLVMPPAGKIESGNIFFDGKDLIDISINEMRKIRGKDISMIFQEPMTSLNPVYTIGNQLAEVFTVHYGVGKKEAWDCSVELLNQVGIPAPEKRIKDYPHALSGGMRQRVMIAMALACQPKLLICDEPTTALDVTIQAQILDLMRKLQSEIGMAIIFISHDLGVIADLCDEVLVMYTGKAVERAETRKLFTEPKHPYTRALLRSIPQLGADHSGELSTISGMVPDLLKLPKGCSFAERCDFVQSKCFEKKPLMIEHASRQVRCFYPVEEPPANG